MGSKSTAAGRVALFVVLLLLSSTVSAQTTLTAPQRGTLKTAILADSTANAFYQNGDLQGLADYYNANAAPDFIVWRTSVAKDEYTNSVSAQGTTFSWTGTGFITRSQGERDAWNAMFGTGGTVNPSLAAVRQAFADIFSGATAPAPANRTHLNNVSQRKATRLEKVFATGTGSTASPATLGVEGAIAYTQFVGL